MSGALRPCEICGRPELVLRGVSGSPRCVTCSLFHWQAVEKGAHPDEIAADMPATISILGDSCPATVTHVTSDEIGIKSIRVRRESRGFDDGEITFTRRKNGRFVEKGGAKHGYSLSLGVRVSRRDPHV